MNHPLLLFPSPLLPTPKPHYTFVYPNNICLPGPRRHVVALCFRLGAQGESLDLYVVRFVLLSLSWHWMVQGGQPQACVWVSLSGSICHGSGQSHAWILEQYVIIATFHVGVTLLGWLTETVIYNYIKTNLLITFYFSVGLTHRTWILFLSFSNPW